MTHTTESLMELAESHAWQCSRRGDGYINTRASLQSAITELVAERDAQSNEMVKRQNAHDALFNRMRDAEVARDTLRAQLDALRGRGPGIKQISISQWLDAGGNLESRLRLESYVYGGKSLYFENPSDCNSYYSTISAFPVAPDQLDALQSGDELPELPFSKRYEESGIGKPFNLFTPKQMYDYARQAQAMARAKILAELGKVEAVAVVDSGLIGNIGWVDGCELVDGQELYTRPLPAQTSSLPERDTSKPAEAQGLFHKFNVTRTDGSDQPGGKHQGCEYFVLDVDHDQHAKPALQAYAKACAQSHPQLSADLIARHGALPAQDFNPDWSQLEATKESLREHMTMLKTAQDVNAELVEALENLMQWHSKTSELWPTGMEQSTFHNRAALTISAALANAKAAQQKEQK